MSLCRSVSRSMTLVILKYAIAPSGGMLVMLLIPWLLTPLRGSHLSFCYEWLGQRTQIYGSDTKNSVQWFTWKSRVQYTEGQPVKSRGAQNETRRLEQNKGQLPGRLHEKRKLERLTQGTKMNWQKKDTQSRGQSEIKRTGNKQNASWKFETNNDKKRLRDLTSCSS